MEDRLVKHVSLKTAKAKLMRKRIADSPSKLYTCTVNDGVLTARWNKLGPAGQACASAQCDAYGCEETERQAERLYVLKKADLTFTPPGQEIMSRRRNKQGEFASLKQDQWKTALKREGDL